MSSRILLQFIKYDLFICSIVGFTFDLYGILIYSKHFFLIHSYVVLIAFFFYLVGLKKIFSLHGVHFPFFVSLSLSCFFLCLELIFQMLNISMVL